jgi:dTDP-4-amino-4,6-dideoxy-D-galactose acyltransferase
MNNSLKILNWDSSFFGYPIGKINADKLGFLELENVINQINRNKIKLVYIFIQKEDIKSKETALSIGAKLVDTKIIFSKTLNPQEELIKDNEITLYQDSIANNNLLDLAYQSGIHSRYRTDVNFKNNEFKKLYNEWIAKSVSKIIADEIIVYGNSPEIGLLTLKKELKKGIIGLFAVDQLHQGKAIGKKLIQKAQNILIMNRIYQIEVATQKCNINACKFYKKMGFNLKKEEDIYHLWL